MEVRENLRAYFAGREPAYDLKRHGSPELVQFMVHEAPPPSGTKAVFRQVQSVALAHAPRVEGCLRKQDPEGISDTSYSNFHSGIITCYYAYGKMSGRLNTGATEIRRSSFSAF